MSGNLIHAAELQSQMEQGRAILIDVREPLEYKEENIPGALNIPLSSLTPESLKVFAGKTIVVQCQSGNRSRQACQRVAAVSQLMPVRDLEGGITAWKKAGLPVQSTGASCSLPLMRQVQLVIGLVIMAGTLLTYFFSPYFLIIPFMMGAGLTNAGITGWCGLAKLMAMMPWNR